ncbi:MAG TPA: DUF202 domain-containing protein [Solirubrobacteraceae bacterium]
MKPGPDRTLDAEVPNGDRDDVTRRTWLAAERTWLAWWRTGLAVSAVALAVGRLLPGLTSGARWPSRILGLGYALLAVGAFVIGAARQRGTAGALRRGSLEELPWRVVSIFTAASILLAAGTFVLIAVKL